MKRHPLFVRTSCRSPAEGREPRCDWVQRRGRYERLSGCPRPRAIALRARARFTHVSGDQQPGETVAAIIECATRYRHTPAGLLPRRERPLVMQAGILARVPPLEAP